MSNAQTLPELQASRSYRTVYWYPSLRCNLACKHCWVKSSPTADTARDLSTEEALKVVEKIREFRAFTILSGGEILFRQDALTILQALIDARVNIAVETNGLLISGQFIAMVRQARVSGLTVNVAISMDGGTAEAHEWMRGRNTFDRTLKAMQLLKDAGIGFDVQCILHRGNAGTIAELFDLMSGFAPQPRQLIFGFLNPVGRGLQIAGDWGLNDAEREEACGLIAAGMSRYPGKVCVKTPPALIPPRYFTSLFSHQGQCYCSTACAFPTLGILPNGNITICALTGDDPSMNFGNIRTASLSQIWKEVRMDEVRHKYVEAKLSGICGDCVFRAMCKGSCRAHAYEEFGEFNAPHPLCDTLFKRGEFPAAYRITALHARTAPELKASEAPTHLPQGPRKETMATRYSDRIQPGNSSVHPIAAAIARFADNRESLTDREWLAAAAGYFLQSFQFVDTRGPVPIEETVRSRRGNCLALSCLLASALKHLGVLKHGVAVFAGCRLLQPERLHAYVLTRGEKPGDLTLVDPQFMKPMNLSLAGFWERHRVYVLFDDLQETTSNGAMRVWLANLAGAPAFEGPRTEARLNPESAHLSGADSTKEDSAPATDSPHAAVRPEGKASQRLEWIVYGTPAAVCGEIAKQLGVNSDSGIGPITRRPLGVMDRLNLSAERLDALDPQWRTKVAVVPEKIARQLARVAHESSQIYARIIAAEKARLAGLARHFTREGRPCSWQELSHIVTAGMVIDMGLRDQLLHLGLIQQQPIDFWMWIFEGGTGAAHGFGVRLRVSNPDQETFHELWHSSTQRPHPLKIDLPDISLLRSLARPGGRAANDLHVEEQRQALKLAFFNLCSRRNGRYHLNIPVLAAADGEAVRAEVRRICGDIVTGTVNRAMEEAAQIYSSEFSSSVADIFKHAFARLLMEHAMDRVLEHKLIEPFPNIADFSWGCWLSWAANE